jgi:hypothetical protein
MFGKLTFLMYALQWQMKHVAKHVSNQFKHSKQHLLCQYRRKCWARLPAKMGKLKHVNSIHPSTQQKLFFKDYLW